MEVGVEFQYGGLTTRARIYSKASIVCNGVDADVKAVNDFNAAQAKIDIGNRHKEPLRERITKLTTALEASGYQLLNCQMEESVYICFLRRD